ncbi:MAG: phosphatase PAP2 family protein [Candidatus Rokubacteria bacterium]|nr:phosphatase PAP2 family protein [Candidatus Rokubacteria bacterium]
MVVRHPRSVLLVSGAVFVALTIAVTLEWSAVSDQAVRGALLSVAPRGVVAVMRIVNRLGDWKILLPATALLFAVFPRARTHWWLWLAVMIVAPAMEGSLKLLVGRARPEDVSMGFPSGHATAAAAYFGSVIYLSESLASPAVRALVRAAAVVAIVLVAIARVVLRAHWPSDALAGIALGLAIASAAALISSARRA